MSNDPKRDLLRHLVATILFRGGAAIVGAPGSFADFRAADGLRTPGELAAHIGDIFEGSHMLMKGELVFLHSTPLPWDENIDRFFRTAGDFDAFLSSGAQLAQPIEKMTQGPIADALTHVGQIVMLRRLAGTPVNVRDYFTPEIAPGLIDRQFITELINDSRY